MPSNQRRKDIRAGFVGPRKSTQFSPLDTLIVQSVALTGTAVVEEISGRERRVVYGPMGQAGRRFKFVT
jgi:hypothetical protein